MQPCLHKEYVVVASNRVVMGTFIFHFLIGKDKVGGLNYLYWFTDYLPCVFHNSASLVRDAALRGGQ